MHLKIVNNKRTTPRRTLFAQVYGLNHWITKVPIAVTLALTKLPAVLAAISRLHRN